MAFIAVSTIVFGFTSVSRAYVDAPTINPPIPTVETPITVYVRAGGCHAFVNDEGEPQVVRKGNHVDLIAPGIASLTPGHPFCINQDFNYPFSIGTLPAGSYTLRILILDSGYPDAPFPFGSVSFDVHAPKSIPSLLPAGLPLLAAFLAAAAIVAFRRQHALPGLSGLVAVAAVAAYCPTAFAEDKTLHVLLSADPLAPTAEEIVEGYDFSAGSDPPLAGLKAEQAVAAEYLVPVRAQGTFAVYLDQNPDSARARLERYIVLHYTPESVLGNAASALAADPDVEHVHIPGPEVPLRLSAGKAPGPGKGLASVYPGWRTQVNADVAWKNAGGWGLVGILDNGLATAHPDLISFSAAGTYRGGNYLPALAVDVGRIGSNGCAAAGTCIEGNVDEAEPMDVVQGSACDLDNDGIATFARAGHGTHVAGLVAANATNSDSTRGACKHCGMAMWRVSRNNCAGDGFLTISIKPQPVDAAVTLQADLGVQVISQSFGRPNLSSPEHCVSNPLNSECLAISHAVEREVVLVAAAGNDRTDIEFPASHPSIVSVGGVGNDLSIWNADPDLPPNHLDDCPQLSVLGKECGSNLTLDQTNARHQELTAPAVEILSTAYPGMDWSPVLRCGDAFDDKPSDGAGLCTGTSMAAPIVAGIAGMLRSINPLLVAGDPDSDIAPLGLRAVLRTNTFEAQAGGNWTPSVGYGRINASASAKRILGSAQGTQIRNRAIPLFAFYNATATDHATVATPQIAVTLGTFQSTPWIPRGNPISGYAAFPMVASASPLIPRANAFVLSTEFRTRANQPPIVPLFLLDRSRPTLLGCTPGTSGCNHQNRDFLLVSDVPDLEAAVADGYRFLGRQGYVFQRCVPEPACVPEGAQRLYRQCDLVEDDCAVFLESERMAFEAEGYAVAYPAAGQRVLGYAYPNVDSDGDTLIDGFEKLIGTNAASADSDGDGVGDGVEYPLAGVPVSDPCSGPAITCQVPEIFADGFQPQ